MTGITSPTQQKVTLAVDDLRVGGIQRLVMDEAYALADQGFIVQILNLGAERDGDSIFSADGMTREKLQSRSIFIINIPPQKFSKLKQLRLFLNTKETNSVICHSPSASFWFRIAALTSFRTIKISLWIHQVLTLSDLGQAFKRVLLSTTANKVFFSAVQFKLEWESHPVDKVIRSLRRRQFRSVDSLGVHVPRLIGTDHGVICELDVTHLVYASRLTPWKGLDMFEKIIHRNPDYHPVIMTVNLPQELSPSMLKAKSLQNHLIICRSPNYLSNLRNAVHVYPTHYGSKVKNPQSIGLNVMEFALLGIPSLVSSEVISTYPEILDSILVESVDWLDDDLVDQRIRHLANLTATDRGIAAQRMRTICSIQKHIDTIKSNL